MALKLHGVSFSNYYCLVKMCLLEKNMDFEEVPARPSQEDEVLSVTPMGRIPFLETPDGFISESYAIADYLEQVQPEPALLPSDNYQRAKVIELIRHIELDVELVARRCVGEAFFKTPVSDEVKATTEKDLARGLASLDRVLVIDPFIAGADFTLADIYARYTFTLAGAIYEKVFGKELLAGRDALKDLLQRLSERDSAKRIEADKAG